MRIALAIPLLLLGACNVTKDGNAVTVQYDQNKAETTAADVGNVAQNIGGAIASDVQQTGAKIENKVGNSDINVKVGSDEHTNTTSNETTTTTTTTKTEHKK